MSPDILVSGGIMTDTLLMGRKERLRSKVMEQVVQKQITLKDAAIKIGVGYRQAKRILKRYREDGDAGLVHKNTGRSSGNKKPDEVKQRVLSLYEEIYSDFGPTFASEKLLERHNIDIDHETLRRWLIEAGLWKRRRKRKDYRSRRERKERFGELIQFDGSHHDWFEGRAPRCCLMNMVDDATGTTLSFLCEQETTVAAMMLLWRWIERYGIPQAVYCDKKNAFVLNREPTIEEQLAGLRPQSPFQKACEKLGIEVIVAHSPQAKGRVERNHGVYQDRLVKELRLVHINTIERGNMFLETTYLPTINEKFAKKPVCPEDAHAPLLDKDILAHVFCFEESRVLSNDYIISYKSRLFQIQKEQKPLPRPKTKVLVRELLDGTIHIFSQGKPLVFFEVKTIHKKEDSVVNWY